MSKQLKRFCRITKYIEKTNPKLYEILDDVCMLGAFKPRRGVAGITFIMPSKDTLAKLAKIVYTDEIDRAVEIIASHIVHDYLPTTSAWTTKKYDIPNGRGKKIEVETVRGSKVVLKDGAELELDQTFKTFSNREQTQAVYNITKGEVDPAKHTKHVGLDTARQEQKTPAAAAQTAKKVTGKGFANFNIQQIAGAMATGGSTKAKAPFDLLVSFYRFVEANHKNLLCYLRLVYDYTVFTTTIFVACHPVFERARQEYTDDPEIYNAEKGKTGRESYCKIVDSIHADLRKSQTTGGNTRSQLNGQIIRIISENQKAHSAKNTLVDLRADNDDDGKFWTSVNFARFLECYKLAEIKQDIRNEPTASDKNTAAESGLQEMCSIIGDIACGKSPTQDAALGNLGILIAGILKEMEAFRDSDFFQYPVNEQSKYDRAKRESVARLQMFSDSSLHAKLQNMSVDQLAKLFDDIKANTQYNSV